MMMMMMMMLTPPNAAQKPKYAMQAYRDMS
jgi:hypothetical protein